MLCYAYQHRVRAGLAALNAAQEEWNASLATFATDRAHDQLLASLPEMTRAEFDRAWGDV